VTADGPPTDWSEEEWSDCGNLQYAKWGGLGTGTGLDWAQDRANAVAEARGEELPYPNRQMDTTDTHNLDDPEFAEGDAVRWSSQDTPVHGRVAAVGDEFEPAEGVTITGDEGEAVYLLHELDDSLSPPQFRRENVAKPESSLSESGLDMPPASEDNFADSENSMTTDTDTDTDDATDGQHREMMEEMMERLVEMQEQQMEMMEEMVDREGPKDGEGEDGDDDEDDEDDGEMSASDADTADTEARTVTLDGTEQPVDEALATLRDEFDSAEVNDLDPETADRAADDDSETDESTGFGMAGVMR